MLQQAAYDAEDRAELLQAEADMERQHREGVNTMDRCRRRLHRKLDGIHEWTTIIWLPC